jgi:hypothetical protein
MVRPLLVLLLMPGLAASAPVPKSLQAKRPPLDGKWVAVEFRVGAADALSANPWVWHIAGGELQALERWGDRLTPNTPNAVFSLTVPDASRPDEVDYRVKTGAADHHFPGRVLSGDDEFTICFPNSQGMVRPEAVKPADKYCYVRFKRVADAKK